MSSASDNNSNDVNEKTILSEFSDYIESSKKTRGYELDNATRLKFLRSRSYDLKESHRLLANYLKIINERKDIFCWRDGVKDIVQQKVYYQYPVKNIDGSKIAIMQPGLWDPKKNPFEDWLTTTLFYCEIGLMDEEVQKSGFTGISIMTGFSLNHVYSMGLSGARLTSYITDHCYPVIINTCNLVYANRYAEFFLNFVSPFLSEELRKKFHILGNNLDVLYKIVPKSNLPPILGGTGQDYSGDHYSDLIDKHKDNIVNYWDSLRKHKEID